ncbi:hypothetical protein MLD52_22565 [Puniceicoccaceae bacterium K14]|nr:hypothetical protein [Puniceicoccaceae bacterium K14]
MRTYTFCPHGLIKKAIEMNGFRSQKDPINMDELLRPIYVKNIRPILILDELDILYYDFCKATLTPSGNIVRQQIHLYEEVIRFFILLTENEIAKSASVYNPLICVAALRETSYDLFKDSNLSGVRFQAADIHKIKIETKDSKAIKQIFKNRLALKAEWLKNNKEIELSERYNSLKKKLDNKIDYSKNIKMSVHGMRHLMNLAHKADISDKSGKLLESFLTRPNNLLLIYQFIDGSSEYSQTNEGVSNIFLVNRDYKKDIIDANESRNSLSCESEKTYLSEHLQTYWLKYLSIYLIYKNQASEKETQLKDIVSVFCSNLENEKGLIYEKEILCLLLLHATEAHHGRLVRAYSDSSESIYNVKIKCTERANYMFDQYVFWSFRYIMVIIEDNYLLFPQSIKAEFSISHNWQRCFFFIKDYSTLGKEEKIRFIKYKAKLSIIFIELLEASFAYEKIRHAVAFSNLERELLKVNTTEIINFERNKDLLESDIYSFALEILESEPLAKEIMSYIKSHEFIKFKKHVRKTIRKDLKKYHSPNFIHSIDNKMDFYTKNRYSEEENLLFRT